MRMTRELVIEARGALARLECVCGGKKQRGHVFCRGCYWRLKPEVQRALYQPVYSEAYAEAYAEAVGVLGRGSAAPREGDGRLF